MTFEDDIPATITFATDVAGSASRRRHHDRRRRHHRHSPVWHLALLIRGHWPLLATDAGGRREQTTGGRVRHRRDADLVAALAQVHFQPTTPALRTSHGCDATAMYPAEGTWTRSAPRRRRGWSVLDVLYSARNALCGYTSTLGHRARHRGRAHLACARRPGGAALDAHGLLKAEWLAFCEWEWGLVAPAATPTETRA